MSARGRVREKNRKAWRKVPLAFQCSRWKSFPSIRCGAWLIDARLLAALPAPPLVARIHPTPNEACRLLSPVTRVAGGRRARTHEGGRASRARAPGGGEMIKTAIRRFIERQTWMAEITTPVQ